MLRLNMLLDTHVYGGIRTDTGFSRLASSQKEAY